MNSNSILSNLQAYAEGLVVDHNLPAISVAVWHDDQLHQAAAGILNLETGVEATTDSIFQIGSISKVMTTSLIMQLVDEGSVDLDDPLKRYIRDFAIADLEGSESITVRQVLNHTSGISGDFFPDDSRETGNPIARYVDRCNLLPLIHPPGKNYAYSNAAFSIAGRLVEVVTGGTWFDAMEERLFRPLGMAHAICRPMDVLRHRAAIGHILSSNSSRSHTPDSWQQTKQLYPTFGQASAGSTATMSAADLITFARAHLNRGLASDGKRWLSEGSVAQMQQSQIELPSLSPVVTSRMGLGWGLHTVNASGRLVFGHGGETFGQMSMLRIVPDQDICLAVLINGENAEVAYQTVINSLLLELANIDLTEPEPTFVTELVHSLNLYVGDYKTLGAHYSITVENIQLTATYRNLITKEAPIKMRLQFLGDDLWMGFNEEGVSTGKIRFLEPDEFGSYQYVFNGRLLPRI
ncbi:beta-lactamase family protein [Porticoccaceae bacterium]|nr:beta-lactamase family protein [Porticoccaceae bacterium]